MLPPIFKNWFQFYYNTHHHSTTSSMKGHRHKKSFRTKNLAKLSKIKWLLTNKFIKCYWLFCWILFYWILFILCEDIMGFAWYSSTRQMLVGNWIYILYIRTHTYIYTHTNTHTHTHTDFSSFGSAIWELSSDYLTSWKFRKKHEKSIFDYNLIKINFE